MRGWRVELKELLLDAVSVFTVWADSLTEEKDCEGGHGSDGIVPFYKFSLKADKRHRTERMIGFR